VRREDVFPSLARLAYLNAGTFGPFPRAAEEAMRAQLRLETEEGRAGQAYFEAMLALRARLRERVAALVGAEPRQVALTTSTTDGCNIVVAGLGLGPEDEVVTTDAEHPGLLFPLHASGARVRVARVRDRPAAEALDLIRAEVGPRTRLVAIQHVSWHTGHLLPLVALSRELSVPVLADGAQSVGAIPVDAAPFDYLTISGQKWLCGPDATGALVVRDPGSLAVAAPTYFSGVLQDPSGAYAPAEGAARFDSGWLPVASLAGWEQALAVHPPDRFERAAAAAARCRELLAERVEVVTEPGHATLVTFVPPAEPAAFARRAWGAGVVIRDLPGTPWVRASCGWWTSGEDLDRLAALLR
jgi:selenocysteine lyase/cysteine desulfurase